MPQARAFDFLLAFRRIRSAWYAGGEGDAERGAVLRSELAALGPISVKIGQTLAQRPDILPEDVCEALKSLQTANRPFRERQAWVIAACGGWRVGVSRIAGISDCRRGGGTLVCALIVRGIIRCHSSRSLPWPHGLSGDAHPQNR